jgi:hypothetical protein
MHGIQGMHTGMQRYRVCRIHGGIQRIQGITGMPGMNMMMMFDDGADADHATTSKGNDSGGAGALLPS